MYSTIATLSNFNSRYVAFLDLDDVTIILS